MQRVDELYGRLSYTFQNRLQQVTNKRENLHQQLLHHSPLPRTERVQIHIQDLKRQLLYQTGLILERNRHHLRELTHILNAASPLSIMDRGDAMVKDLENQPITSVKAVKVNTLFSVQVSDGSILGRVEKATLSRRGSKRKSEP